MTSYSSARVEKLFANYFYEKFAGEKVKLQHLIRSAEAKQLQGDTESLAKSFASMYSIGTNANLDEERIESRKINNGMRYTVPVVGDSALFAYRPMGGFPIGWSPPATLKGNNLEFEYTGQGPAQLEKRFLHDLEIVKTQLANVVAAVSEQHKALVQIALAEIPIRQRMLEAEQTELASLKYPPKQ